MIKAIPSNNKNEFYENNDVIELVNSALDNLDNGDVFLNILTLITSRSFKKLKNLMNYSNQIVKAIVYYMMIYWCCLKRFMRIITFVII